MPTCPKCGSNSIIGEDPKVGWGKCRKCKLGWRYVSKNYVEYSEEFNSKTWWVATVLLKNTK